MTSSNGNIFRVTGHLCGEFTGPRWIPAQRPVTRNFFSLICVWINGWVNNCKAGDLRRYRAHYDVTVMDFADLHKEGASKMGHNGVALIIKTKARRWILQHTSECRYYALQCNASSRMWIIFCTHKRHPISRPHGRTITVCCENIGENRLRYNGTALYFDITSSYVAEPRILIVIPWPIVTTPPQVVIRIPTNQVPGMVTACKHESISGFYLWIMCIYMVLKIHIPL